MADWRILVGRVTLFPALPYDRKASELFRAVWGGEPDSFQTGPSGAIGGASVASGSRPPHSLSVSVQPGRVDFNVGARDPSGPPTLDMMLMSKDALFPVLDGLVERLPDVRSNRAAFFLSLAIRGESVEAANRVIVAAVDEKYRPPRLTDEEDFVLQVNTGTASRTQVDVRINVISKFSVERMQTFVFNPQAFQGPNSSPIREDTVSMISIDVNNRASLGPFELHSLRELVREMKELAYSRANEYLG